MACLRLCFLYHYSECWKTNFQTWPKRRSQNTFFSISQHQMFSQHQMLAPNCQESSPLKNTYNILYLYAYPLESATPFKRPNASHHTINWITYFHCWMAENQQIKTDGTSNPTRNLFTLSSVLTLNVKHFSQNASDRQKKSINWNAVQWKYMYMYIKKTLYWPSISSSTILASIPLSKYTLWYLQHKHNLRWQVIFWLWTWQMSN